MASSIFSWKEKYVSQIDPVPGKIFRGIKGKSINNIIVDIYVLLPKYGIILFK